METKAFEVRDAATFIPVIATLMEPGGERARAEAYLLRRSGYGLGSRLIMLCRMDANGAIPHLASYDPYGWGMARTMGQAHIYIQEHWPELQSGAVIDVEFMLGETCTEKESEERGTIQ